LAAIDALMHTMTMSQNVVTTQLGLALTTRQLVLHRSNIFDSPSLNYRPPCAAGGCYPPHLLMGLKLFYAAVAGASRLLVMARLWWAPFCLGALADHPDALLVGTQPLLRLEPVAHGLNSARARIFMSFRRRGCSAQSGDSAWIGWATILLLHGARINLEAMAIHAQIDRHRMVIPIGATPDGWSS
jgi:hypothetical protein